MNTKTKSLKQERKLAKDIGAKETPASGALDTAKGDMVLGDKLIEAKATDKESMVLHLSWLKKIELEALRTGKTPVLILEIQGVRYWVVREVDAT